MITVEITEEQVDRAERLYEFKNLKGSITKGESQIYGALGEVLTKDYFEDVHRVVFDSTYDYDMIIDDHKVDVKTKRTTVTPRPEYYCSISAFNTKQKCDYYFFIRIMEDLKIGFLLGYIKKEDFFKLATLNKRGEVDPTGNGKWVFKDDCYNLSIQMLKRFK